MRVAAQSLSSVCGKEVLHKLTSKSHTMAGVGFPFVTNQSITGDIIISRIKKIQRVVLKH